ncbi:MAG: DNA polymerase III subunit delta [Hydrogenobacter sp.]
MNLLEYQKGLENREIKPINLVQVEDEYVLKTFIDKLSNLYEVKILWGDELDRKSFFSAFSEGEMFTKKRRVYIVKKAEELLKSAKDTNYLISVAKRLKNVSIFLVVSEKLTKQQLEKEPIKTLLSVGEFLEAKVPNKKKIKELVKNRFEREGRKIDEQALDYLLEITSYNLMELRNEVDKLLLYKEDRITIDDVKRVCVSNVEYTVFDFLDAFFNKDLERALLYLSSLLRAGIHPLQIQAVMISYAIKLFSLVSSGEDKEKAFVELGLTNPYVKNSFKTYAEKFSLEELKQMILRLHQLDMIEKVYFADPEESLKRFVIEYLRYAIR